MDPLIGSALIGVGAKGLETVANGFLQQRAAAYNQDIYERNQAANYLYQMNAQRNAARNEVEGLRQAGLSPVFADGAQGMSVASGTQGTASAPQSSLDPANIMLMAQARLMEAQADKTDEEVEALKLSNENTKSYNETLSVNLPNLFDELSKDTRYDETLRSSFAAAAKDIREEGINEGAARGLEKYLNLRFEQKQQLTKELQNEFDWQVVYSKYDDPSVVSAVARLPVSQKHNLENLSLQYVAQVGLLNQTKETEKERRNQIISEIYKIDREAQAILHSDPAQMKKEHDSQGLLWFIGTSMMGSLDRKADAAIRGAFGKGK